ncbi:MAG: radical SAM protein [Desulfobulbus propionicus]|nr:MAG: radical SAM protein [Desulfobulbus propionicus]
MAQIVPIFIPHEGCRHSCSFCNQHAISGAAQRRVRAAQVALEIETWLERFTRVPDEQVEVAFYGGSFTGLSKERQLELLGAVTPFLTSGKVHHVRLSTRPDYIDQERIDLLKAHQVQIVELGVQSLDDHVLGLAGRGHTARDVKTSVQLLQANGMQVGMQLMLGLPGQSFSSLRKTVQQTIARKPDCVRMYPVLVVTGSALEKAYRNGSYTPLSLSKAVLQAAYMKKRFDQHGIQVIRMGLQPAESLTQTLVAGPYHPSFGEMVLSRLMLKQVRQLLAGHTEPVQLFIHPRDMSIFRGMRSANMYRLAELGLLESFELQTDETIPRCTVRVAAHA